VLGRPRGQRRTGAVAAETVAVRPVAPGGVSR
jgi:hypothetical protein